MDPEEQRRQQEAMMAGNVPGLGMVQLPEFSERVEGPQTTVKSVEMAPGRIEAIEKQKKAADAEVEAQGKAGEAAVRAREAEEQLAKDTVEQNEKRDAALAADALRREEMRKERQAADQAAQEAMKAAAKGRATTYWADKGKPAEIFSHILVGLSERSHRLAGGQAGESPMQKELDRAMAEDAQIKMAKFENSKEFVEASRQNSALAEELAAKRREEIMNEHIVMIDSLMARAQVQIAAANTEEARANGARMMAELEGKKQKLIADQLKDADRETVSAGSKTTTTENTSAPTKSTPRITREVTASRSAYKEIETNARGIAEILEKNPKALDEYKEAERAWDQRQARGELPAGIGKTANMVDSALFGRLAKDDYYEKLSPDARALADKIEAMDAQNALVGGKAGTAKGLLGARGKTAKEVIDSARDYGKEAARKRGDLEQSFQLPESTDAPKEEPPAPRDSAKKNKALTDLLNLKPFTRGYMPPGHVETLKAAEAAGIDEKIIKDQVKRLQR